MDLIVKLETDQLKATRVLCVALLAPETGNVVMAADNCKGLPPIRDAVAAIEACDGAIVCQSRYAVDTLERLHGLQVDAERVVDLVKVAHGVRPGEPAGLDAWAARLKVARVSFRGADVLTHGVLDHCMRDARLIGRIYKELTKEIVIP